MAITLNALKDINPSDVVLSTTSPATAILTAAGLKVRTPPAAPPKEAVSSSDPIFRGIVVTESGTEYRVWEADLDDGHGPILFVQADGMPKPRPVIGVYDNEKSEDCFYSMRSSSHANGKLVGYSQDDLQGKPCCRLDQARLEIGMRMLNLSGSFRTEPIVKVPASLSRRS